MDLSANMAEFFRKFAAKHNMSISKLQIIVDVSRNTFYAYARGEGNPSLSSINCIADSLGVDPITILLGIYDPGGSKVSVLLLDTIRGVSELTPEDRQRFIKLFIREMMRLWGAE